MISLWTSRTFLLALASLGSDIILAMSCGAAGQLKAFAISSPPLRRLAAICLWVLAMAQALRLGHGILVLPEQRRVSLPHGRDRRRALADLIDQHRAQVRHVAVGEARVDSFIPGQADQKIVDHGGDGVLAPQPVE